MRSVILRSAAALLSVAAMTGSSAVLANASTERAASPRACTPHTQGVARMSAAQVLHAVNANIPRACGFEISGFLLGASYTVDGVELLGHTTYDPAGNVHLVYLDQGIVIDVYRAAGKEYVRLYEDGSPTAKPDVNLITMWHAFGVGTSVINAAGSTKWVRLTGAEQKKFNGPASDPSTIGTLASPAGFAAAMVKGTGKSWKLSGTKTLGGVHCTVLTDPADSNGLYPATTLYVNTATGLPVEIRYAQGRTSITTNFAAWSRTASISAPRQIVAG